MLIARLQFCQFPLHFGSRFTASFSKISQPLWISHSRTKLSIESQKNAFMSFRSGPLTSKICYFYRSDDTYINMEKDYYAILQVNKDASPQQIKQSFYILAKKHHPDRTNGDQSVFKQLNEAYNVLSQPRLKKQYDQDRVDFEARVVQDNQSENGQSFKKNINYGPYSQMSKAQWAVYRQGYMKQSKVDYSNYQRNFSPELDSELNWKEHQQWKRAYKSIKPEQIDEQNEFRQKLFKKYKEDMIKIKQAKERYYDEKFNRIGDKIEKVFGKTIRGFFNKLVSR